MKNIHVLPTDKPSKLCKNNDNFYYVKDGIFNLGKEKYNIYITSDEEIKEPCWCWDILQKKIYWVHNTSPEYPTIGNYFKKIVLTTDQDLIKDGVQTTDDEFLEFFIKKPTYEEVKVVIEQYTQNIHKDIWYNRYKIIIPQEKLTYTEAAKKEERIFNASITIPKQEIQSKQDWEFERSSGYAGYRNKVTDEWIYEDEYLNKFREVELKARFTKEELFKATLEALDYGMRIRQEQLNGYSEKSGKELHKKWFNNLIMI